MDWETGGKRDGILAGSIVGGILGAILIVLLGISLWNNVVGPRYHAWREANNPANNNAAANNPNAQQQQPGGQHGMQPGRLTVVDTVELSAYVPSSMPSNQTCSYK